MKEQKVFSRTVKAKRRHLLNLFLLLNLQVQKKSQLANEVCQPAPKLSEIIVEIRDKIIKQQEEEKANAWDFEKQGWDEEDEAILKQAGIIEEAVVQVDYSDIFDAGAKCT